MKNFESFEEFLQSDYYKHLRVLGKLHEDLGNARSYFDKLKAIRTYYQSKEQDFIRRPFTWHDTYPCDWFEIMTPIEWCAWKEMRSRGNIVMYPQYPVLGYHLDFANPGIKLGIELDGKDYHDQDNDIIRDIDLVNAGWTIIRIPGKEMINTHYKNFETLFDSGIHETNQVIDNISYWILKTGDGVLEAISYLFFHRNGNYFDDAAIQEAYRDLCERTLKNHQLTNG
jgi:very-short-patch-repair endonuclease